MRIERTGEVLPLTPRLRRFLVEALRGVDLDNITSHEKTRPDFSCLGGLLVIELKSLQEDGSVRLGNLTEELQGRDDWPVFLSSAPIQAFLKHTRDPDGLNRKVVSRIGRAIVNHLKKANRQLEAHQKARPRRNTVRTLVLANEDNEIYDPQTVAFVINQALTISEAGAPRYGHIDLVIYLTERHAQVIGNRIAHPTMLFQGQGMAETPWKLSIAKFFAEKWARWNGQTMIDGSGSEFVAIDHIPDSAPRSDRWRMDYQRYSYNRHLSVEQLRERFDEITVMSWASFRTDSPVDVPTEAKIQCVALFAHITAEMSDRAIPGIAFKLEISRLADAASRLGMPPEFIQWLATPPNPI